ncbi:hypothetical protein [Veillonella sp.]|uniref:hypothetical protein n=1 Tax=Veillonella sp. TaxID=1926307 RepID=UPI002911C92B|nr:hypothetical protein [Veillonella sp.]MDU4573849.1 hypothetical protein [Veillonella sp.]
MLNLTNLQTKGYDELIEIDGEVVYLELAIKHIQSKGANLSRFNIFKGNKPL